MIELKNLTKIYGNTVAVDDLNLTLDTGHVYGFLGPNGAGKSTTLNMLTGYIGATSGEVIVEGHDINTEPQAAKKCMGYLPEMPPVYGDMRVGEYLNFAADLKGLPKATRVADIRQVMDLTKLHDMENRLIRNLSKGYRQRVGLAQALMGMPPIIILDEPTVGLDPKQIIEIRELIASLRENHTVILSSHILQEISAVCDYVFIISHGKLVASDTMENLESEVAGAQQIKLLLKTDAETAASLEDIGDVKSCEVDGVSSEVIKAVAAKLAQVDEAEEDEPEKEDSKEEDSKEVESKEDDSKEESKEEKSDGEEVKAEDSAGEDSKEEDSKEEDSKEEDSKEEDSKEEDSKEEDSKEEDSKEEESKGKKSKKKKHKKSEDEPKEEESKEEEPALSINETKEIKVVLTAKTGKDIREEVFHYCVEHDMVILNMARVTKSLEDVFLELTKEEEVA